MSVPPVSSDVVDIAAPLLFGVMLNWTLYGFLLVQILYAVFLFETLQTALSGGDVYYWFASGFGKMDRLLDPYASTFDDPIMGSIISGTVQIFFAYRVWVLSDRKAWWYGVTIVGCSAVNTASAISGGVYAQVTRKFVNPHMLRIFALACVAGSAMTDFLIAAAMFFYLTRQRNAEIGSFRNHAFVKIVRLTVETNILTTACGIASAMMVIVFPGKIYYTCPNAILGKLYSNTLLVSLNNRISIREMVSGRRTLPTPATSRTCAVPTSNEPLSIVHVELEGLPHSLEGRKGAKE